MSWKDGMDLKKVINASGKMTHLGATAVTPDIAAAASEAAQGYFDMEELLVEAGKKIARLTGAEAGCPTSCAAAGIALSIASCITGPDESLAKRLPSTSSLKNRIIIQKGHCVDFGAPVTQMVRMAGGVPVEVGSVNLTTRSDVEGAIDDMTAGFLFVKSHHCVQKGVLSLEEYIGIAKKHGLPVVIDAAAEEDVRKYVKMGAGLVVYSGHKAVGGSTSGFVIGRKDLVDGVRVQYGGIGRPMKVGKESIAGLLCALEKYTTETDDDKLAGREASVDRIIEGLKGIPGIKVSKKYDEAGRPIPRAWIEVTPRAKLDAAGLVKALKEGPVAIFTRDHYLNVNCIAIDPRPLLEGDEAAIVEAIRRIMA